MPLFVCLKQSIFFCSQLLGPAIHSGICLECCGSSEQSKCANFFHKDTWNPFVFRPFHARCQHLLPILPQKRKLYISLGTGINKISVWISTVQVNCGSADIKMWNMFVVGNWRKRREYLLSLSIIQTQPGLALTSPRLYPTFVHLLYKIKWNIKCSKFYLEV